MERIFDILVPGTPGSASRRFLIAASLWLFAGVNLLGLRLYERTLIPLMIAMFALGGIVIVAGFMFDLTDTYRIAFSVMALLLLISVPMTLSLESQQRFAARNRASRARTRLSGA